MYFVVFWRDEGKDRGEGIVQGVGLDDELCFRDPVSKDRSGSEGGLERLKGRTALIVEKPRSTLPGEPGKRNDNSGIVGNKPSIEVSESKEGLYILNLPCISPVMH